MNAVGIIIVKGNSNRFPGKNIYPVQGKPMFFHNVELLINCVDIDDVYVCTDSHYIREYCLTEGVKIIWRGENVREDEEPYLSVLKYAYQCIDKQYNHIATILPNTVGHTQKNVDNAVKFIKEKDLHEVRSCDSSGIENGILIFKESVILQAPAISSYMGIVYSGGKEIHYKEELSE